MSLILIGTNYRYSDVAVREKLAFSQSGIITFLSQILKEGISTGAVILSTCQRIEIYAETYDLETIAEFLFRYKGEAKNLKNLFYIKKNEEAVYHLFMVAAGLDSQIIGENEILHQVKEAYLLARSNNKTTTLLNRLFERSLFIGRLVRSKTGIAKADPSLSLKAVDKAEALAGNLSLKNIFIIGAGVVSGAIAKHCAERGAKCVIVANRTFEKALNLASQIGARAVTFEKFYNLFFKVQILFSATGSRHLILKKEIFQRIRQPQQKILIFDLALPRDIDPEIGYLDGVRLFNLDDLKDEGIWRDEETILASWLVKDKAEKFLLKVKTIWKSESAPEQALLP
ncbi:MAG: glutamyl-tRNA reductase [Candidatus Omnitrophota bacterium]